LNVNARYEIDNVFRAEKKLFHAFFLLREMFRLGVIEQYSTLDPKKFGKRYPALGKQSSDHKDWLFARHWYSTFVDVLTDLRETGTGYSWEPGPDVELMIQPLPFSAFSVQELTAGLGAGLESPNDQFAAQGTATRHPMISCWGEWHFAVLNGTENQALAIEIINHLMSSNAVCERAARCAALPTVEEFYKRYADVPCLRLPEREDVKIQRLTYRQLRDRFFRIAKTRRSVFDYRHCLREIHSVLTLIQHIATTISDAHLADEVLNAVDRIHLLQYQEMLIH
jgi:hypothetical protein